MKRAEEVDPLNPVWIAWQGDLLWYAGTIPTSRPSTAWKKPAASGSKALGQAWQLVDVQRNDGIDVFRQSVFIGHPHSVRDSTNQHHVDGELPTEVFTLAEFKWA